jgi:hypothetical protein
MSSCPRNHLRRLATCRGRTAKLRTIPRRRREPPEGTEPPLHTVARSLRGLDWFIFFVADVQTGFGPFVSVYLTTQRWTQFDIGLVLSAAGFVSLIGQMPGGALVDAADRSALSPASPSRPSASAPWPMRRCRSFRWCWRRRCCTRSRVACSARPWSRSVSAWSGTRRSANGLDATRASPPSATAWRRRRWAPAAIAFRPRCFHRHRAVARAGAAGAALDFCSRDRSRARPRRAAAAAR